MRTRGQWISALAAVALGCAGGVDGLGDDGGSGGSAGSGGSGGGFMGLFDAGLSGDDAGADAGAVVSDLPTWALVDVQPQSPRTGQSYGLQAFLGRPLVVMLLQGY